MEIWLHVPDDGIVCFCGTFAATAFQKCCQLGKLRTLCFKFKYLSKTCRNADFKIAINEQTLKPQQRGPIKLVESII